MKLPWFIKKLWLTDVLHPTTIHFLCEQDGEPERNFKTILIPIFKNHIGIQRAYLARINYGNDAEENVALCIILESGKQQELANELGKAFHNFFAKGQHIDIIFINREQENALSEVCEPFYRAS